MSIRCTINSLIFTLASIYTRRKSLEVLSIIKATSLSSNTHSHSKHQLTNHRTRHASRKQQTSSLILLLRTGEDLPESQRLISSSRNNGRSIWTYSKIQHTIGMSSKRCNLLHGGVLPNNNLVEGVAVGADDFIAILRPCQVADL